MGMTAKELRDKLDVYIMLAGEDADVKLTFQSEGCVGQSDLGLATLNAGTVYLEGV